MASNKKVKEVPFSISVRNQKQAEYLETINSNYVTFCVGPAGCGKTFLACQQAMADIMDLRMGKIVLVRPAIEAGESIGFLPGTLEEKMNPFMAPLYDAFNEHWQNEKIEDYIKAKIIEIVPLAFMRGRTFRDAFIIIDEAQNINHDQMKMLLTRFGDGCRMVIAGDKTQTDLRGTRSGLEAGLKLADYGVEGIASFEFGIEDVVRHQVVMDVLNAWEALGF